MLRPSVTSLLPVVVAISGVSCKTLTDRAAARTEGERWLRLVDDGQYERAWDEGSALLKASVSRDYWARGERTARDTRGALLSREFLGSAYRAQNRYSVGIVDTVVLSYRAVYEERAASKEEIAVVRDSDGVWRVFLYLRGMRLK